MGLRSSIKRAILPSGTRAYRIRSGPFRGLQMEMDLQGSVQVFSGLYERETHRWLYRFGAGCAAGIDVGVAQGEFSLYLLAKTSAKTVFAFEPSAEHDGTFSRNLALNGLAKDERLNRFSEFAGTGENGTARLDALADALSSPVFVKVDVDGAEVEVLRGMRGLFERLQMRLLLETHSPQLEARSVELLREYRCEVRVVRNAWWRAVIRDQRPIPFNRWLVASNDPSCPV